MSDYVSFSAIVFSYPGLLAIVVTGVLYCWWRMYVDARSQRKMLAAIRFIKDGQYEQSTPMEMVALYGFASEYGCRERVGPALDAIRKAYGLPLKRGHMWWIRKQIEGAIPWGHVPPVCVPGKGLAGDPLTKDLRV